MKAHLLVRKYEKPALASRWKTALRSEVLHWLELAEDQTKEKTVKFATWESGLAERIPDGHDRHHGWTVGAGIVARYFALDANGMWQGGLSRASNIRADDHMVNLLVAVNAAKDVEFAAGAGGFHAAGGALNCVLTSLMNIRQIYTCQHIFTDWAWFHERDTGECGQTRRCHQCGRRDYISDLPEELFRRLMQNRHQIITMISDKDYEALYG